MTEVCERLDDDDIYGDVIARPVGELVALICRDLGLEPDWARLAEEAWAREEIERGDARSPFANLHREAVANPPARTIDHQGHQERPELGTAHDAPS
jgi:hypothetical protein